jgi:hypothetical protein
MKDYMQPTKPKYAVVAYEKGKRIVRPARYQREGIIEVWKKGKPTYWNVDPDLYAAMAQMNEMSYGWLTKLLAIPSRLLRTGATSAPGFALRNPFRDMQFAFIAAKHGFVPGWDWTKGLFTLAKKPELYWRWKASGGPWSMLVSMDRARSEAKLREVLGHKNYKQYIKNPLGILQNISMIGEIPTRLGVFMRAAKKPTVSDLEAAFESREASIDFMRMGAKMKVFSQIKAFFNANLQAVDKMIRVAKERPLDFTIRTTIGSIMPAIGLYLLNRDDPVYWQIPEWRRDIFWIIPIVRGKMEGGKIVKRGIYLPIPKGDVGIMFGTSTEKILTWMDLHKETREGLDKLALDVFRLEDLAKGGFIPDALKIPTEILTNHKFFYGRPIITVGQETLDRPYQHGPFTSETAKALGKVFKVSPAKLEHLITGWTAELGRHALRLNDIVAGEMGLIPKKAARPKELADYSWNIFFVRDPQGFESEGVQMYYEKMKEIESFQRTQKELKMRGEAKERIKYVKKHPLEHAIATRRVEGERDTLATQFRQTRTLLSAMRKLYQMSMDSHEMTVEQKKRLKDEVDAAVMISVYSILTKYNALKAIVEEEQKRKR